MKVVRITDKIEFNTYRNIIDEFIRTNDSKSLFFTFDYLETWLEVFCKTEFIILLVFKEDNLIGFCPLFRSEKQLLFGIKFRQYKNAGEGLWGYSGILANEINLEESINCILEYCFKELRFFKIEIGPFPEESLAIKPLSQFTPRKTRLEILKDAPYIDTRQGFENYAKNKLTKKSTIPDVQRCTRRLSEIGTLSFHKLNNEISFDDFKKFLDIYLQLYNAQWEESRFKKDGRYKDLYLDFGYKALKTGYAEFSYLTLDAKIIAIHYGFKLNGSLYYFTPTYDIEFRKFSPGKVLLFHLIQEAFNEQIEFDFLNHLESYKLDWTDTIRSRIIIRIYRNLLYRLIDDLLVIRSKSRILAISLLRNSNRFFHSETKR